MKSKTVSKFKTTITRTLRRNAFMIAAILLSLTGCTIENKKSDEDFYIENRIKEITKLDFDYKHPSSISINFENEYYSYYYYKEKESADIISHFYRIPLKNSISLDEFRNSKIYKNQLMKPITLKTNYHSFNAWGEKVSKVVRFYVLSNHSLALDACDDNKEIYYSDDYSINYNDFKNYVQSIGEKVNF